MTEPITRVRVRHGEEVASTADILHRKRTGDLPIPFANITVIESIATGFRQQMFDLGDDEGNGGGVSAGAGLGTDFITLEWGDKRAVIRGLDLLRAWVATFDPEAASDFPDGLS